MGHWFFSCLRLLPKHRFFLGLESASLATRTIPPTLLGLWFTTHPQYPGLARFHNHTSYVSQFHRVNLSLSLSLPPIYMHTYVLLVRFLCRILTNITHLQYLSCLYAIEKTLVSETNPWIHNPALAKSEGNDKCVLAGWPVIPQCRRKTFGKGSSEVAEIWLILI